MASWRGRDFGDDNRVVSVLTRGPTCQQKKEKENGEGEADCCWAGCCARCWAAGGLARLARPGWPFSYFYLFEPFSFSKFLETLITFEIQNQMESNQLVKFCKNNIYQNIPFGNIFTQPKLPKYPWAFKWYFELFLKFRNKIKYFPNNLRKHFLDRLTKKNTLVLFSANTTNHPHKIFLKVH